MTPDIPHREQMPQALLDLVWPIMADVEALAATAGDVFASARSSSAVARLRRPIGELLDRHAGLVVGCGIVVVPGVLSDAVRFIDWWWRTSSQGVLEPLRANLDLTSPDSFDYTAAPWFREPVAGRAQTVTGPYLDVACSNTYVVTIASPVIVDGEVRAIAAADVPVQRLESLALPVLVSLGRPALIVNADGRVVASTSPAHLPGSRLTELPPASGWSTVLV